MLISLILWFRTNSGAFGLITEQKKKKWCKGKQQVTPWHQHSAKNSSLWHVGANTVFNILLYGT